METLTLTITFTKHPDTVPKDNPDIDNRNIGFKVTTTLESDIPASESLQDKYKLVQYVKDNYFIQYRSSDTSDDWADYPPETNNDYARDEFGEIDDRGVWFSEPKKTTFLDEPGFLGDGINGQALPNTQRLGTYKVEFYWDIMNGDEKLLTTPKFTLEADPDDDGVIDYKIPDGYEIEVEVEV